MILWTLEWSKATPQPDLDEDSLPYVLTPNIDYEIFLDVIKRSLCEASHSH